MNIKVTLKRFLFICLLLGGFLPVVYAQYPVQVVPQLNSPYSLHLNEYYNGTSPKLIVTLTNQDLQKPVLNVRLKMTIKSQDAILVSKSNVYYPTIVLNAGIPQSLSLSDLAPYFNANNLDFQGMTRQQYLQQGVLPEGYYSFCFEAIEITTGLTVSRQECAMAWISLNDPPLLNTPANALLITENNPINIVFNWTPRNTNSANAAYNTEYIFQLVEVGYSVTNIQAAFLSQQPLYTETTNATSLLYGPTQPILLAGKKYAWRVQAKAKEGVLDADIYKNNGQSEIYAFTYYSNCPSPQFIESGVSGANVTINWSNANRVTGNTIEYGPKGSSPLTWNSLNTIDDSIILSNL